MFSSRVWTAPVGGDAPARYAVQWRYADGRLEDVGIGRPVVAAVEFDGSVYFVDGSETLFRFSEGETLVHRDVLEAPALSEQGDRLAYVVRDETGPESVRAEVHLVLDGRDVVVDRSLQSFGAARFTPDGAALLGVGAGEGGVAGVHRIALAVDGDAVGARCLSNCELRVGRPWTNFVANPGSAQALQFDGDQVSWDAHGERAVRSWR